MTDVNERKNKMFDALAQGLGAVQLVLPNMEKITIYKVSPEELLEALELVYQSRLKEYDHPTN